MGMHDGDGSPTVCGLGWQWSGGDGVGNEAEQVEKSYPRAGLKGCAKNLHFLISVLKEY